MPWGLGPVFAYEWLVNARKWQVYAVRSISVAALMIAMATVASSNTKMSTDRSFRAHAQLGEYYFYALIGVELALVMLAAPAATAGAICLDRSSGTLAHMLVTDLSDREIVLGKLAARLLPVLGLVACSWPVLAISSLLGGIDPVALTLAFAVIVAVAVLGCTLAMTLSVWAKKTHEVVMVVYTLWALVLLSYPMWLGLSRGGKIAGPPRWVLLADPFYLAFSPYVAPGQTGTWEYVGFFATMVVLSALLTLVAVLRMRPVTVRESGRGETIPRLGVIGRIVRKLPRPSLEGNPVLWREWHRSRPSTWMAWLIGFVAGTTSIACVIGAITFWKEGVQYGGSPWKGAGVYAYMLQMLFGLLMLSAVAPMSLSEERQRGSLDVLMASPLSTRTIVWGKWLGTFRFVPLLAIGPGLVALAMATGKARVWPPPPPGTLSIYRDSLRLNERLFGAALMVFTILAHGAVITSLGLALATWTKRQSRAITLSLSAFVLVAIAWPFLILVLTRAPADGGQELAVLSPIFLGGKIADGLTIRFPGARGAFWSGLAWDVFVAIVAVGLLELTVRGFDRCLGRMTDGDGTIWPGPKKGKPLFDDLLVGDREAIRSGPI